MSCGHDLPILLDFSMHSLLKPQKTEEVACVAGPRKNGHARGRHARGERRPAGRTTKIVQLEFCECGYFQLVERPPSEKLTALGEKTVNQYYMDNVVKVLYYDTSS